MTGRKLVRCVLFETPLMSKLCENILSAVTRVFDNVYGEELRHLADRYRDRKRLYDEFRIALRLKRDAFRDKLREAVSQVINNAIANVDLDFISTRCNISPEVLRAIFEKFRNLVLEHLTRRALLKVHARFRRGKVENLLVYVVPYKEESLASLFIRATSEVLKDEELSHVRNVLNEVSRLTLEYSVYLLQVIDRVLTNIHNATTLHITQMLVGKSKKETYQLLKRHDSLLRTSLRKLLENARNDALIRLRDFLKQQAEEGSKLVEDEQGRTLLYWRLQELNDIALRIIDRITSQVKIRVRVTISKKHRKVVGLRVEVSFPRINVYTLLNILKHGMHVFLQGY